MQIHANIRPGRQEGERKEGGGGGRVEDGLRMDEGIPIPF